MLGIIFPYYHSIPERSRQAHAPPHGHLSISRLLLRYPALSVLSLLDIETFTTLEETSDTGNRTRAHEEMQRHGYHRQGGIGGNKGHYENMLCMSLDEMVSG